MRHGASISRWVWIIAGLLVVLIAIYVGVYGVSVFEGTATASAQRSLNALASVVDRGCQYKQPDKTFTHTYPGVQQISVRGGDALEGRLEDGYVVAPLEECQTVEVDGTIGGGEDVQIRINYKDDHSKAVLSRVEN
ncbi:MAG: hypothetical protein SVW77_02690 [Candidatus Nanohaloarchaea archaeon]|nr:hypothetical protein [Candidatus Nanohaloarchaea archaeon]